MEMYAGPRLIMLLLLWIDSTYRIVIRTLERTKPGKCAYKPLFGDLN